MFFVRHLAKVPKPTFASYPGCIVIAAGGLKPVDADASLFSFEDVSRYDANGLALDLDAVSARFWFKVCTRMDYLQAASSVCASHFKRNIEKAATLDADRLFVEIFKLLPSDKR